MWTRTVFPNRKRFSKLLGIDAKLTLGVVLTAGLTAATVAKVLNKPT